MSYKVGKALLMEDCPINMLCKLYKSSLSTWYATSLGELIETYLNYECITDRELDFKR